MPDTNAMPTVRFTRFVEIGRPPQRADRAAGGTLPTRAFRYCESATTASALGWYVFPPIAFRIFWTGSETLWTYAGAESWFPLGSAQFPGFRQRFEENAPDKVKNYSPPFLGALPEPGIVQIWSGLVARTKPGWSLLVRSPANLPRSSGYDVFEGLVEADQWFGPLFVNVRLSRTGSPVEFDPNRPLFQVQPVQREAYSDNTLDDIVVSGFADTSDLDWADYHRTVVLPSQNRCPHGTYAAGVRKRRRADVKSRRPNAAHL